MILNKRNLLLLSFALIINSNGYTRYKSIPLQKMHRQVDTVNQEHLSFSCKMLNKNDCKKYFNTTSLNKKGYLPIQITFTNNSNKSIAVSPDSFSFRCANAQDIATLLHRNGLMRGICFTFGSLIFLPLIIPALVQGIGADNYNYQMDIDFSNKSFENQVVPPFTVVDGIIFASKNQFTRNFTLIVKDVSKNNSFILHPNKPQLLI